MLTGLAPDLFNQRLSVCEIGVDFFPVIPVISQSEVDLTQCQMRVLIGKLLGTQPWALASATSSTTFVPAPSMQGIPCSSRTMCS